MWNNDLKGKTVKIKDQAGLEINGQNLAGEDFIIEDLWKNMTGSSWKTQVPGNPACMLYSYRSNDLDLPDDDMVIYGKVGGFGHLLHITELNIEGGDNNGEE